MTTQTPSIYVLTIKGPLDGDANLAAASSDAGALMTRAQFDLMDQIGASLARERPLVWSVSQECPNAAWEAYVEGFELRYRIESVERRL